MANDPADSDLPDLSPLLICRLECPAAMTADVDGWMPKHFDDALDEPPVTQASGYRVLQDFSSEMGLPWILNGHGNRFVAYATHSPEGMIEWLGGEMAEDSISDGAEREARYPLLDAEPFTGNIYLGRRVIHPVQAEFAADAPILVERFEVSRSDESEFTAWLEGDYMARWADLPQVTRVRTFKQLLDVPDQFPYTRYMSKGNFMLWVDLLGDPIEFARSPGAHALFSNSIQWDVRLPYVRREIAENFVIRTKNDALKTYATRRTTTGGSS